MKIDINKIDKTKFLVKEKDGFYLINPNYNYVEYNDDELIYRSSLWSKEGELVSAGFKKFFNWGEQIKVSKQPEEIIPNHNFIEKIDGSLLIVSRYKNQMIYRTRGTHSIYQFSNVISDEYNINPISNFKEVDEFRKKYKIDEYMFEEDDETSQYSLLFEWVTPSNKIILDFKEPDLYLVGCIDHLDYSYYSQEWVDVIAKKLKVKRPERHSFNTLEEMFKVKYWINKEGICMYYNNDQSIVKIKSLDYLKKHKFKSNMNYERLVDIFIEHKFESLLHLFDYFEETYDFEIRQYLENEYFAIIQDRQFKLEYLIDRCKKYIFHLLHGSNRKEQALSIIKHYPNAIERAICFCLLDNPIVSDKLIKKFYLDIDIEEEK